MFIFVGLGVTSDLLFTLDVERDPTTECTLNVEMGKYKRVSALCVKLGPTCDFVSTLVDDSERTLGVKMGPVCDFTLIIDGDLAPVRDLVPTLSVNMDAVSDVAPVLCICELGTKKDSLLECDVSVAPLNNPVCVIVDLDTTSDFVCPCEVMGLMVSVGDTILSGSIKNSLSLNDSPHPQLYVLICF